MDGERDHFSGIARAYRRHRPSYPEALVAFLAETAPGCGLAWDAGCGSGQLSTLLARRFDRVVATDSSPEQIASAAPHPRVEYRLAPAEGSRLPDASADLVTAAQAAHWFDLDAWYAEVERVARPGGAVALISYGSVRIEPALDRIVEHFYGDVLRPHWPPQRRHVEEGYRTLPFPFEPVEAPELEIRVRWKLADLLGYVGTWSAVRSLERLEGTEPLDAFARRLDAAWGDASRVRTVRWPLTVRAGRAAAGRRTA